jgi:hypothetical protein
VQSGLSYTYQFEGNIYVITHVTQGVFDSPK